MKLTGYEVRILDALCDSWGMCTREVAARVGSHEASINRASSSALMLASLRRLEKLGLVKRKDRDYPIAWVRVPTSQPEVQ